MTITVTCKCNKTFKVKDTSAGRRVKCPVCERSVRVPSPDDEEEEAQTLIYGQADIHEPVAPRPTRPKKAKKPAKPKQAWWRISRVWLIRLGAGGGVCLVVFWWWLFWPTRWAADFEANLKDTGEIVPEYIDAPPAGTIRLPRALSQPPDWLVQEAPFDVRKFWVTVPDGENAAPLYLDALYEFSPEMELCFPLEDRPKRTPPAKSRSEAAAKWKKQWDADPAKAIAAERDTILLQHAVGLQKIADAQQRPRCVFEIGWDNAAQAPLIDGVRAFDRLAQMRCGREIEQDDFDAAFRTIDMTLRFSRDLRYRTSHLLQAVANTIDQSVVDKMLIPILKSPKLTVAQCDDLMKMLLQHESALREIDPFLASMQGAYISKRMLLHDLEHKSGEFAESEYHHAFGIQNATRGGALFSATHGDLRHLLGYWDDEIERLRVTRAWVTSTANAVLSQLKPTEYVECGEILNDWYKSQVSRRFAPHTARTELFKERELFMDPRRWGGSRIEFNRNLIKFPFVVGWKRWWTMNNGSRNQQPLSLNEITASLRMRNDMSASRIPHEKSRTPMLAFYLMDSDWESQLGSNFNHDLVISHDAVGRTRLQAAKALVALRRWYGTHAIPPTDLAAVCHEAGLPDLPQDYVVNAPLQMAHFAANTSVINTSTNAAVTIHAGETLIYSVGRDAVDDKALKMLTRENMWWGYGNGDLMFRLEIPQSAISAK